MLKPVGFCENCQQSRTGIAHCIMHAASSCALPLGPRPSTQRSRQRPGARKDTLRAAVPM
eukprot:7401469-Pyramimonas_sp.AAC.1